MSSGRKASLGGKREPGSRRRGKRFPYAKPRNGLRPRIGMRVGLTALFVLVTAFAAVAAYEIVRPILEDTLNRASQARFEEVAEQFEEQNRLNNEWSVQRIR